MTGLGPYAAFAVVAAAALAAYIPSFSVPFQFDDYGRIVDNTSLQRGDLFGGIRWLGSSRPIPSATIALNYQLGRDDPFGYHLINWFVHLFATLGVFRLACALCRTPAVRDSWLGERRTMFAAAAAFLFACHPLQTQAVTYIIQRSTAMAAMFYVWSVVAYLEARNRAGAGRSARIAYAGCILLAVCAVLSKESAITLPVAIVLTEWVFFGLRGKLRKAAPFAAAGLFILALPVAWKSVASSTMRSDFASLPWFPRLVRGLFAQGAPQDLRVTAAEYFLTQTTVLPRYLRLVLLPVGLNVDHDVAIQHGASAGVVAGLAVLAALALVGLAAVPRWPVVGFGILWFFIASSVESSVLPIADLMMEHRMYLAMPGIVLAAAALLVFVARQRRAVGAALAGLLFVLLPSLTFARNRTWQTPLSLWGDALGNSPHKARVHVNVGVAHHGVGQLDDAIRHYCIALDLDPKIAVARDNLEVALDQQGKLDAVIDELMRAPRKVSRPAEGTLLFEYDVARVACPPILGRATTE